MNVSRKKLILSFDSGLEEKCSNVKELFLTNSYLTLIL